MWTTEYSQVTDLSPEAVWATFLQIHAGELNLPGGDRFEPDGPIRVGARLQVTPEGQPTMTSVVTELEEATVYADQTAYEGLILTFRHRFSPDGDGTQVTHELVIDGDSADEVGPEIGPQISADFPEQMTALIEAAKR